MAFFLDWVRREGTVNLPSSQKPANLNKTLKTRYANHNTSQDRASGWIQDRTSSVRKMVTSRKRPVSIIPLDKRTRHRTSPISQPPRKRASPENVSRYANHKGMISKLSCWDNQSDDPDECDETLDEITWEFDASISPTVRQDDMKWPEIIVPGGHRGTGDDSKKKMKTRDSKTNLDVLKDEKKRVQGKQTGRGDGNTRKGKGEKHSRADLKAAVGRAKKQKEDVEQKQGWAFNCRRHIAGRPNGSTRDVKHRVTLDIPTTKSSRVAPSEKGSPKKSPTKKVQTPYRRAKEKKSTKPAEHSPDSEPDFHRHHCGTELNLENSDNQLFGNRSETSLVCKRDSWIWFSPESRPSVENFVARQRKFQSEDPRVAELAAEIRRQEEMNRDIEREAESLIESSSLSLRKPSVSPGMLEMELDNGDDLKRNCGPAKARISPCKQSGKNAATRSPRPVSKRCPQRKQGGEKTSPRQTIRATSMDSRGEMLSKEKRGVKQAQCKPKISGRDTKSVSHQPASHQNNFREDVFSLPTTDDYLNNEISNASPASPSVDRSRRSASKPSNTILSSVSQTIFYCTTPTPHIIDLSPTTGRYSPLYDNSHLIPSRAESPYSDEEQVLQPITVSHTWAEASDVNVSRKILTPTRHSAKPRYRTSRLSPPESPSKQTKYPVHKSPTSSSASPEGKPNSEVVEKEASRTLKRAPHCDSHSTEAFYSPTNVERQNKLASPVRRQGCEESFTKKAQNRHHEQATHKLANVTTKLISKAVEHRGRSPTFSLQTGGEYSDPLHTETLPKTITARTFPKQISNTLSSSNNKGSIDNLTSKLPRLAPGYRSDGVKALIKSPNMNISTGESESESVQREKSGADPSIRHVLINREVNTAVHKILFDTEQSSSSQSPSGRPKTTVANTAADCKTSGSSERENEKANGHNIKSLGAEQVSSQATTLSLGTSGKESGSERDYMQSCKFLGKDSDTSDLPETGDSCLVDVDNSCNQMRKWRRTNIYARNYYLGKRVVKRKAVESEATFRNEAPNSRWKKTDPTWSKTVSPRLYSPQLKAQSPSPKPSLTSNLKIKPILKAPKTRSHSLENCHSNLSDQGQSRLGYSRRAQSGLSPSKSKCIKFNEEIESKELMNEQEVERRESSTEDESLLMLHTQNSVVKAGVGDEALKVVSYSDTYWAKKAASNTPCRCNSKIGTALAKQNKTSESAVGAMRISQHLPSSADSPADGKIESALPVDPRKHVVSRSTNNSSSNLPYRGDSTLNALRQDCSTKTTQFLFVTQAKRVLDNTQPQHGMGLYRHPKNTNIDTFKHPQLCSALIQHSSSTKSIKPNFESNMSKKENSSTFRTHCKSAGRLQRESPNLPKTSKTTRVADRGKIKDFQEDLPIHHSRFIHLQKQIKQFRNNGPLADNKTPISMRAARSLLASVCREAPKLRSHLVQSSKSERMSCKNTKVVDKVEPSSMLLPPTSSDEEEIQHGESGQSKQIHYECSTSILKSYPLCISMQNGTDHNKACAPANGSNPDSGYDESLSDKAYFDLCAHTLLGVQNVPDEIRSTLQSTENNIVSQHIRGSSSLSSGCDESGSSDDLALRSKSSKLYDSEHDTLPSGSDEIFTSHEYREAVHTGSPIRTSHSCIHKTESESQQVDGKLTVNWNNQTQGLSQSRMINTLFDSTTEKFLRERQQRESEMDAPNDKTYSIICETPAEYKRKDHKPNTSSVDTNKTVDNDKECSPLTTSCELTTPKSSRTRGQPANSATRLVSERKLDGGLRLEAGKPSTQNVDGWFGYKEDIGNTHGECGKSQLRKELDTHGNFSQEILPIKNTLSGDSFIDKFETNSMSSCLDLMAYTLETSSTLPSADIPLSQEKASLLGATTTSLSESEHCAFGQETSCSTDTDYKLLASPFSCLLESEVSQTPSSNLRQETNITCAFDKSDMIEEYALTSFSDSIYSTDDGLILTSEITSEHDGGEAAESSTGCDLTWTIDLTPSMANSELASRIDLPPTSSDEEDDKMNGHKKSGHMHDCKAHFNSGHPIVVTDDIPSSLSVTEKVEGTKNKRLLNAKSLSVSKYQRQKSSLETTATEDSHTMSSKWDATLLANTGANTDSVTAAQRRAVIPTRSMEFSDLLRLF